MQLTPSGCRFIVHGTPEGPTCRAISLSGEYKVGMIARLVVVLPFSFVVPDGAQFSICPATIDGYVVRVLPPVKTDLPVADDEPIEISIDDVPAFRVNGLRVDFHKDQFDRRRRGNGVGDAADRVAPIQSGTQPSGAGVSGGASGYRGEGVRYPGRQGNGGRGVPD